MGDLIILVIDLVLTGIAATYFVGTRKYYPRERRADDSLVQIKDERLPALLDRMESVLEARSIKFSRSAPDVLSIPERKWPAQSVLESLEREAGLTPSDPISNKAQEPTR